MSEAILEAKDLHISYGAVEAIHGINLSIREGQIVTLIGSNGAGKSTILKCISGLLPCTQGSITYRGECIHNLPAVDVVKRGIAHVPEGRRVFPQLTVYENLLMGGFLVRDKSLVSERIAECYSLFPILKRRASQLGGTLSGGEQQMLAIARALVSGPSVLLLDEPSMGLSPKLVEEVGDIIRNLKERGVTILLVEQNATLALSVADYGYVIETGHLAVHGEAASLARDPHVVSVYLGLDTTT